MEKTQLAEIASQYGTPVYVLDQAELEKSLNEIVEAFSAFEAKVGIAYPYKTNPLRKICRFMREKGLSAEVSSLDEINMAISLGVDSRKIVINSPYKSNETLTRALQLGCQVNVDNFEEIGRIAEVVNKLGINKQRIGIRVSPKSKTNWEKFGFALHEEAYEVLEYLRKNHHLQVIGIHTHRSNIIDLETYYEYLDEIFDFVVHAVRSGLIELEYLNLGSGYAVNYPAPIGADEWKAPSMRQYSQTIASIWSKFHIPRETNLIIEPGRRLVAGCVSLLTQVVSIKKRPDRKIAIVDSGHNLMPGVEIYRYPISQLLTKKSEPEIYEVHGCLSDSIDLLGKDVPLAALSSGEILEIGSVGGYDMSRSFHWQIPLAPIVWVDTNLHDEIVRYREPFDSLWKLGI
jgi:diaminopimelate decarboxylase